MILRNEHQSLLLDGESGVRLEGLYISGYEVNSLLGAESELTGVICHSRSLGKRDVKIEGYISEELEANRRALGQICTQDGEFYLVDGDYMLALVLTSGIEISYEKKFSTKLLKFTLYARTTNPLWQATEEEGVPGISCGGNSTDERAIRLVNSGDAPVGFSLYLYIRIGAPNISFSKNGKYLTLTGLSLETGDQLFIDTRRGKKSVNLIKKGTSTPISVLDKVLLGSTFFELDVGDNKIDYSLVDSVVTATISFRPCYMR